MTTLIVAHIVGLPVEEALLPIITAGSMGVLAARSLLDRVHRRRPRPATRDDPPIDIAHANRAMPVDW